MDKLYWGAVVIFAIGWYIEQRMYVDGYTRRKRDPYKPIDYLGVFSIGEFVGYLIRSLVAPAFVWFPDILIASTAEAMFSLSSYRSRAVRNGEMPRIAATSLPPIPCLRYVSHSCSVRASVLTSTLGSRRMCSGILSPSSRAGDRDASAGSAHCTADTANCVGWVLPCAGA